MAAPALEQVRRVQLGPEPVEYRLFRSSRSTLGIAVAPGGGLRVTAPAETGVARIEAALRRRRGWIRRQLRDALERPPAAPPPEWVGGETHRYLGRQYRLKIRLGEPGVSLRGGYFEVSVREKQPDQVRAVMERWYRDHARALFQSRAADLVAATPRLRLREVPPIRVRRLAKRWGSCTPNGTLVLNVDAIKLPLGCVDYLLVHELCHHRVPHHGRQFWRLLEVCMPDWERWRQRLVRAEI